MSGHDEHSDGNITIVETGKQIPVTVVDSNALAKLRAERDAALALLGEARPYVSTAIRLVDSDAMARQPRELLARIDAALAKGAGDGE